jgi:hypothetical protein
MHTTSETKLLISLQSGRVYRREEMTTFSKAIDRDLKKLSDKGVLLKAGPGLYYKPKFSRFGLLPPKEKELVHSFLGDTHFLLFSWNDYNALNLGLSQVYNSYIVYNYKRYLEQELGGKLFHFRRPSRGFPSKLSKEYLLVDLVDNINALEDPMEITLRIRKQLGNFNTTQVLTLARRYGKERTKKIFEELCEGK